MWVVGKIVVGSFSLHFLILVRVSYSVLHSSNVLNVIQCKRTDHISSILYLFQCERPI